MNPTQHIKNFRDVGESINLLVGLEVMKESVLYRGGRLNAIFKHEELLLIPSILNLRIAKDEKKFNCIYLHVPATDKLENYDTTHRKVKKWINNVMGTMLKEEVHFPIYIHCTSGKDRTGVIVAVILKALGIEDKVIIEEYLLSDGITGQAEITQALKGIGDINTYLKSEYVCLLRKVLLNA
ncbi:MAG: Protein-tyrosine phosphatase [uncultured Sulfurovum sp.]|uniref:Protein-tyrosine phosphatase n=1 Tax=uncultured Sulfurovum sp. TaxID=269237 RepID=A0A6S6TXH4_9BACT|nr:MAG: Protein-tyrosine phosphatase [uncultured Sulfurovum sp.]